MTSDIKLYHLKKIRDALTHRFVNIKWISEAEDSENMSEITLVEKTIQLAKLTRNAIIYLLQFVYLQESKKERESDGLIPILYAQDIPDELK